MKALRTMIGIATLVLASTSAMADRTWESALGLSMDQARQVKDIEMKYRKPYTEKRGKYMNERRWMRQAMVDKDAAKVAKQEEIVAGLEDELRTIRNAEHAEIRALLTPEQGVKFEQELKLRKEMKGSSRDENFL